jgi:tRNA pseudouridine38-40 synthase
MSQRYKIVIAYDGTAYAGWQVQPGRRTIQGEIEHALQQITGSHVRVESSGRTDRGVHARGQVAHFDLPSAMPPAKLLIGINSFLDDDIRIMRAAQAPSDFHARFSATGKEYRYFIRNEPVRDPFARAYAAWMYGTLDVPAMQQAAKVLEGRHDFAAFAANPKREVDGTVRCLYELRVTQRSADIMIRAKGDGFLYKMVRSLAGFLIRVGRGELKPEMAHTILASKLRTARVPTAMPEGLFLWKVYYRPIKSSMLDAG